METLVFDESRALQQLPCIGRIPFQQTRLRRLSGNWQFRSVLTLVSSLLPLAGQLLCSTRDLCPRIEGNYIRITER
jgi:hypothetical protein